MSGRAGAGSSGLPDALVIATAIRSSAEVLVTTDRRWPAAGDLGYQGNMIIL